MDLNLQNDSILRLVRHPLYYIGTTLYGLWSIYAAIQSRWYLSLIGYFPEFRPKFAYLTHFLSQVFPLLLCLALLLLAVCGLKKAISRRVCTLAQISLFSLILACFCGQVCIITLRTVTIHVFLYDLPMLISGFVGNLAFPAISAIFAICYLGKYKHKQEAGSIAVWLSAFLFATVFFKLLDLLISAKHLARGFQTTFWEYAFGFPFETFSPMIVCLCFAALILWIERQKTSTV